MSLLHTRRLNQVQLQHLYPHTVKARTFLVSDESGNAYMREIKDQTDGRTYDRQASFQFIQPTEKSVHTTREDNIFPRRIYEIQEAVTCSSTKMEIDGNRHPNLLLLLIKM